ncbi:MAG TPA: hypothetical protein VI757_11770 [Bacteroidia bacterium]|nr:hypothetical protein [Bacteroidia bacterium]
MILFFSGYIVKVLLNFFYQHVHLISNFLVTPPSRKPSNVETYRDANRDANREHDFTF